MRTSNKNAYDAVMAKEKFTASNMWGEWIRTGGWVGGDSYKAEDVREVYVVYSYGRHFPMWVWDESAGQWIGNKDKYSRSTTRQQSQTRPYEVKTWLDTDEIKEVVRQGGLAEYTMWKARV